MEKAEAIPEDQEAAATSRPDPRIWTEYPCVGHSHRELSRLVCKGRPEFEDRVALGRDVPPANRWVEGQQVSGQRSCIKQDVVIVDSIER